MYEYKRADPMGVRISGVRLVHRLDFPSFLVRGGALGARPSVCLHIHMIRTVFRNIMGHQLSWSVRPQPRGSRCIRPKTRDPADPIPVAMGTRTILAMVLHKSLMQAVPHTRAPLETLFLETQRCLLSTLSAAARRW